jgi:hypothetical protein
MANANRPTVRSNLVKIPYFITLLTLLSCTSPAKQADTKSHSDSLTPSPQTSQPDKVKYYTDRDSLAITTETGEILKYSKEEFNAIVDNHPELYSDNVKDPDETYCCNADNKRFGSEAGKDEYYMLYAYFLKQKNGIDKYAERRKQLIGIYSNLNSLFGHIEYGGTYFGHQASRILGYAEYAIYLYKYYEDKFSKTYDIEKQKDLYLKSLRQLIDDENTIDNETLGEAKIKRSKELNAIVDKLDKAITDHFYLGQSQEFQYKNYQYY